MSGLFYLNSPFSVLKQCSRIKHLQISSTFSSCISSLHEEMHRTCRLEAGGKQKKHSPKGNIPRHVDTDLNLRTVPLSCTLQPAAEEAQWSSRFAPSNLKIKVKASNFIYSFKCRKLYHCLPSAKSVLKPLLHFLVDIDLSYSQDLGKISLGLTKG